MQRKVELPHSARSRRMQAAALNVDADVPCDNSRTASVVLRRLQSMALKRTAGCTKKLIGLVLSELPEAEKNEKGSGA